MRLNLSETHSDKKTRKIELNPEVYQKDAKGNLAVSYYPSAGKGVKLNQSGILYSEYKNISVIKK